MREVAVPVDRADRIAFFDFLPGEDLHLVEVLVSLLYTPMHGVDVLFERVPSILRSEALKTNHALAALARVLLVGWDVRGV